jgi:hypothetical protein
VKRILSLILLVALPLSAAQAAPRRVDGDTSDNQFWFTYDSATGDIESASSSRTLRKRDPVAFLLYIRERPNGAIGKRLAARLELELLRDRPVRYRGDFSIEITDGLGNVVYRGTERANVVLRPKAGQREETLRVRFDLPSGDYSAKAIFAAD